MQAAPQSEEISKSPLERRVLELCGGVLAAEGYRIVDLDCVAVGRGLIRLFIEPTETTSVRSTSLEDCVRVTRLLEPFLDAQNVMPGSYDLEVSSPGLERRLRVRKDFEAAVGATARLELLEKMNEMGKMTGKILEIQEGCVVINVDGKISAVPLLNIKRAQLVVSKF